MDHAAWSDDVIYYVLIAKHENRFFLKPHQPATLVSRLL